MLFGMLFCAVSLAIVWGTTLERIKFGAYVIYAAVFGAVIYPLVAHGVYGGGLLADVGGKPVMDFAGSSVVHLTGAVGALAALLLLGPRIGKYGPTASRGRSPGTRCRWSASASRSCGSAGTGSTPARRSARADNFMAEVALNTQLAAAAGVLGGVRGRLHEDEVARRRHGRQRRDRRPGRRSPPRRGTSSSGRLRSSGWSAGVIVVYGVYAIDKRLDDPVGALSAHGLAGIWGTLAVGLFASDRG